MPDQNADTPVQDTPKLPPPKGDGEQAEKYLDKLIDLLKSDKVLVSQTDLKKFDPGALQNHYLLTLESYQVEVSHSKQPDSGQDFYVLLFNNLKQIKEGCNEKVILAYMPLSSDQFQKFKIVADEQIEKKKREAEEKRFKEAMAPIDQALENLNLENPQPEEPKAEKVPDFLAATPPDPLESSSSESTSS